MTPEQFIGWADLIGCAIAYAAKETAPIMEGTA